jgi:hypothetical protein
MTATQLNVASDDSIWSRVAENTLRARRSAVMASPSREPTRPCSSSSVDWARTVVRFEMVSATTPVARVWASENACSAAMTLRMRTASTAAKTTTRAKSTTATGQANTASTHSAPSTVTAMRMNPQLTVSMSSTKAQEKVSSAEITSPAGRSVCQRWLSEIRWS